MSKKNKTTMEPGPGDVIEPAFDEGKPGTPDKWREKLHSRDRMLRYLKTGERYWYGESFGSEKRRTKA
jgi:hypothetical protein